MPKIDFPGHRSTNDSSHSAVRRSRRVALLAVVAGGLSAAALATSGVAMAADPIGSVAPEHEVHGAAVNAFDISSYSIVNGAPITVPANGRALASVLCPSGTRVLGGGENNDANRELLLTVSRPSDNGSGWETIVINTSNTERHATARAVCGR
jgi:hypothetical protein